MLVAPGTSADLDRSLPREAAEQVARNWWMLLLNGILLVAAGILIFSIDWSVRSLATFIGALFVMQGVVEAVTAGVDPRVRRVNIITGLLSIAAGIAIIAWPGPGLLAVGIFLGAWLIVTGTLTIAGALAARRILPAWWLLLILGLLEVPQTYCLLRLGLPALHQCRTSTVAFPSKPRPSWAIRPRCWSIFRAASISWCSGHAATARFARCCSAASLSE